MKPKLILIFLLIVLLPLAALSWLGLRVAREEQGVVQNQFRELLIGRLRDIDAVVARSTGKREEELLRLMETVSDDGTMLRELVRKNSLVREVFVLDASGKRIHPPLGGPFTASEKDFLERAGQVWRDKQTFYRANDEVYSPGGSFHRAPSIGSSHGWYTWYWGNGINLIFWRRDPSGHVIGIECDRTRMLADIVSELPNTDPADPNLPHGRIAVVDASGAPVYQWGAYEPAASEPPRVTLELIPPLHAWKLAYFVSSGGFNQGFGRSILFNFAAGIIVIWIALIGMAVYFYCESTRAMREAAQRVSFVNQISHELKTPLTNIRMYAELLEGGLPDGDEKAAHHLAVIVSESQRLSRLIGNVLTFARQQKNKLTLHMATGCVDEVIRSVLACFRPTLNSKGVKVEFLADAGATVGFDRDALEQILGNLLSNVEKYAATGGLLEVTSVQTGDQTLIRIADRGPGIPKEQEERIFEPFYRLSNKVTDGVAGTGIGLAIARDLARKHGGDLTLLPSSEGASFQISLRTSTAKGQIPS